MKIAIVGPIATESIAAFLSGTVDPLPPGYGGAPLLGTLIGELLKRGHEVSAFTTSSGVPLGKNHWVTAEGERFRIHYCGLRPRAFRPQQGRLGRAADFFALERACLKNAIFSVAPEVIHAHWSYEFGLAALATGLPHVITCHDAPHVVLKYMPNLYRLVRYWMARQCLAKARVVTAVSPYLQAEIQPYCSVPVAVIPNPLPDEVFTCDANNNESVNSIPKPIIAMVINGWGKRKNPEPALLAFRILRNRIPDAELHLYGADFGSGQRAELWATQKGIMEGMTFFGSTPHALLLQQVRKADVLLHSALEECCPMGIAEAMALGLPVVGGATSGGVPWVVGDGGLMADVTSPPAIADALYALLTNANSRRQYAHAAASRARQTFSVKTVADSYEAQYYRALERPSVHLRIETA